MSVAVHLQFSGMLNDCKEHTMHGVQTLDETIKSFSESLGLRLDGEFAVHTNISRTSAMNIECKVSPAKMEAWKM